MARTLYQVNQGPILIAVCRDEEDAQTLVAQHDGATIETYKGWIGVIRDGGRGEPSKGLIEELIADGLIEAPTAVED